MPLTENGKLDVKALPDVERDQTRVRIMPQSAIQEILAGFWRQILQLEEIGIDENFFETGRPLSVGYPACVKDQRSVETRIPTAQAL